MPKTLLRILAGLLAVTLTANSVPAAATGTLTSPPITSLEVRRSLFEQEALTLAYSFGSLKPLVRDALNGRRPVVRYALGAAALAAVGGVAVHSPQKLMLLAVLAMAFKSGGMSSSNDPLSNKHYVMGTFDVQTRDFTLKHVPDSIQDPRERMLRRQMTRYSPDFEKVEQFFEYLQLCYQQLPPRVDQVVIITNIDGHLAGRNLQNPSIYTTAKGQTVLSVPLYLLPGPLSSADEEDAVDNYHWSVDKLLKEIGKVAGPSGQAPRPRSVPIYDFNRLMSLLLAASVIAGWHALHPSGAETLALPLVLSTLTPPSKEDSIDQSYTLLGIFDVHKRTKRLGRANPDLPINPEQLSAKYRFFEEPFLSISNYFDALQEEPELFLPEHIDQVWVVEGAAHQTVGFNVMNNARCIFISVHQIPRGSVEDPEYRSAAIQLKERGISSISAYGYLKSQGWPKGTFLMSALLAVSAAGAAAALYASGVGPQVFALFAGALGFAYANSQRDDPNYPYWRVASYDFNTDTITTHTASVLWRQAILMKRVNSVSYPDIQYFLHFVADNKNLFIDDPSLFPNRIDELAIVAPWAAPNGVIAQTISFELINGKRTAIIPALMLPSESLDSSVYVRKATALLIALKQKQFQWENAPKKPETPPAPDNTDEKDPSSSRGGPGMWPIFIGLYDRVGARHPFLGYAVLPSVLETALSLGITWVVAPVNILTVSVTWILMHLIPPATHLWNGWYLPMRQFKEILKATSRIPPWFFLGIAVIDGIALQLAWGHLLPHASSLLGLVLSMAIPHLFLGVVAWKTGKAYDYSAHYHALAEHILVALYLDRMLDRREVGENPEAKETLWTLFSYIEGWRDLRILERDLQRVHKGADWPFWDQTEPYLLQRDTVMENLQNYAEILQRSAANHPGALSWFAWPDDFAQFLLGEFKGMPRSEEIIPSFDVHLPWIARFTKGIPRRVIYKWGWRQVKNTLNAGWIEGRELSQAEIDKLPDTLRTLTVRLDELIHYSIDPQLTVDVDYTLQEIHLWYRKYGRLFWGRPNWNVLNEKAQRALLGMLQSHDPARRVHAKQILKIFRGVPRSTDQPGRPSLDSEASPHSPSTQSSPEPGNRPLQTAA